MKSIEMISETARMTRSSCRKKQEGLCPKCPVADYIAGGRLKIPIDQDLLLEGVMSQLFCPPGKKLTLGPRWTSKPPNGVLVCQLALGFVDWMNNNKL